MVIIKGPEIVLCLRTNISETNLSSETFGRNLEKCNKMGLNHKILMGKYILHTSKFDSKMCHQYVFFKLFSAFGPKILVKMSQNKKVWFGHISVTDGNCLSLNIKASANTMCCLRIKILDDILSNEYRRVFSN